MRILFGFCVLVGLLAAGAPGTAAAQSFDCEQAGSRAEHLICADAGLGLLDEGLDKAYRINLDLAADQRALITSQRAWLRERDGCTDAVCIFRAISRRLPQLYEVPQAADVTWSDPRFGISMIIRGNREMAPCDSAEDDPCIILRGRQNGDITDILTLRAFPGGLAQTAREQAGFEQQPGRGWMSTYGRFEPVHVEDMSNDAWTGLTTSITCGVSDAETGFHAAGGECLWTVLSDGTRSVLLTTDGRNDPNDPAIFTSTHSIRFLPTP